MQCFYFSVFEVFAPHPLGLINSATNILISSFVKINFWKHSIEFLKKSCPAKNSSIIKVTASFKFYNFIFPGSFVTCLQRFVPWKFSHTHLKEQKALPLDRLMLYISVQSMSGQMSEFLFPGVITIFYNCYWRTVARAVCCCFALYLNKNAEKRAEV